MLVTRAGLGAACLVAGALAIAPTAALGDSDPASDFLPTQDVFLPYRPPVSAKVKADLLGVTRAARRARYPVKVAVIATATDLGGVPDLFNQPARYAGYLGREISFNSKGTPLVVAMPAGLGTFQAGPKGGAAAAGIKVGEGSDGLGRAAVQAVLKVAAANGHPIRGFKPSATASGGGGSSGLIFAVPVALLVIALAVLSYRRAGGEEEEPEPEEEGAVA
jgi:hypothetical protein